MTTCENYGGRKVVAIDAATGTSRTISTFRIGQDQKVSPMYGCTDTVGGIVGQLFDADYRRMAVTSQAQADGSRHIGYLDRASSFVDLSPSESGFSGPVVHTTALFSPADGRIWFYDRGDMASVDPAAGARSIRQEPYKAQSSTQPGVKNKYYFSAGKPRNISGLSRSVYLGGSSDRRIIYVPLDGYYAVSGDESYSDKAPMATSDNPEACIPWPFPASPTSIFCDLKGGLGRLEVSSDFGSYTQTRITPPTKRNLKDPVASPDGREFAFVAVTGGKTALYKGSFSQPDAEPVKVADLPTGTHQLMAWR